MNLTIQFMVSLLMLIPIVLSGLHGFGVIRKSDNIQARVLSLWVCIAGSVLMTLMIVISLR